jgi:HK97 gp10 family phage protein
MSELIGADEVLTKLRSLSGKMQKRGVRRAARKAMTIVRNAARQNAKMLDDPESAARIFKNIILRESGKAGKRVGGIVMKVGIKGGAAVNQHGADVSTLSGGDTRHWRFIEYGTSTASATPFMRPALSQNIQPVTQTFMTALKNEIELSLSGVA